MAAVEFECNNCDHMWINGSPDQCPNCGSRSIFVGCNEELFDDESDGEDDDDSDSEID